MKDFFSDTLIIVGFLSVTGGIALISVPWSLIVGGAMLIFAGYPKTTKKPKVK